MILTLGLRPGRLPGPGAGSAAAQADDKHPVVVMDTSHGRDHASSSTPEKAPITVENFLKYVDDKFFDDLIFHRVIPGFMIQGGGFDDAVEPEGGRASAPRSSNESGNGLTNVTRHDRHGADERPEFGDQPVLHQPRRQPRSRPGRRLRGLRQGDRRDGRRRQDRQRRTTTADGRRPAMANVPVEPVVIKSVRRKAKS